MMKKNDCFIFFVLGPSSGYSVGVDHGHGVSHQRVSGFDDQGNEFGYEHDFKH